jgi:hypothetical protein
MPSVFPFSLDDTVTARWWRRLVGSGARAKRHWRTKTTYYRAVYELLRTAGSTPLTWQSIVAATRPNGNRSTFYEVTGPSAKHALMSDLRAASSLDAMQICLCYQRRSVVDQLVDETKVWAYWPHREALVARYRIAPDLGPAAAADLLISSVTTWARGNPQLARILNNAPPVCAVEDLVAINAGRLSPTNSYGVLAATIRDAIADHQVRDPVRDAAAA